MTPKTCGQCQFYADTSGAAQALCVASPPSVIDHPFSNSVEDLVRVSWQPAVLATRLQCKQFNLRPVDPSAP